MKRLPIANIGSKGLNTDIPPWDLPNDFITYGKNFRVDSNYIYSSGGYINWSDAPSLFYPGYVMFVDDISGRTWLVAGRDAVYAFNGSSWSDISSVGFPGLAADAELMWQGCMLGRIPIINNFNHYPEYWSPPTIGQQLVPLNFSPGNTWDDVNKKAYCIRSHKNFLFALRLQEGSTEYPDGYRWSHPADINGLPYTWDETDPASIAGIAQLGSNFGTIVDGLSLRDSFAIYSTSGINLLSLSNDEFIWNRRELSNTVGLANMRCIAEVKGTHYFIADGDVLSNDGNSIQSIMHNRIQRDFAGRINSSFFDRSFVVRNIAAKEIWFCIADSDNEYPNIAYVWNWSNDSWAIRDLVPNLAHAGFGTQADSDPSWDNTVGTWDQSLSPWGSQKRTPFDDTVIGVDNSSSSLVILDPNNVSDDDQLSSTIERTDMPLTTIDEVNMLTRIYPRIEGTSEVEVTIGAQKYPGAPVLWKAPIIFNPGTDRKIDVRSTGALHAYRIKSIGLGVWRFSGMDIEYESAGKR